MLEIINSTNQHKNAAEKKNSRFFLQKWGEKWKCSDFGQLIVLFNSVRNFARDFTLGFSNRLSNEVHKWCVNHMSATSRVFDVKPLEQLENLKKHEIKQFFLLLHNAAI